ncbi:MAG: hypothetical protein ACOC0L_00100 [bacterium]
MNTPNVLFIYLGDDLRQTRNLYGEYPETVREFNAKLEKAECRRHSVQANLSRHPAV